MLATTSFSTNLLGGKWYNCTIAGEGVVIMEQAQMIRKKSKKFWKKGSEGLCHYALSGLAGFVLGGGTFQGHALPLGACLVAAQPPGGRALGAVIGSVAGYFFRCDPAEAVEYTAVSLLVLMTMYLFQGTTLPGHGWFMPLCCGFIYLTMGGVRLLGSVEVGILPWIAKGVLSILGTVIFRKAIGGHRKNRVIFGGALVFCLAGVGRYVDIGLCGALAVASVTGELLPGAVMGMALDIGSGDTFYHTFLTVLPGVICKLLRVKRRETAALLYGIVPVITLAAMGEGQVPRLLGVAFGSVIGYVLSRSPILTPEVTTSEEEDTRNISEQVAAILDALGGELPNPCQLQGGETERIFDAVGERVCRSCSLFHRCWEKGSRDTYEALSAAAPRILKRGIAREEDFSQDFRERCCCFQSLLLAVNGELEGMLYRRRYYAELRENRRILEREYRLLAHFLRKAGKNDMPEKERRFIPLVSICSAKKSRERVSGDRGVCFMAPDNSYYVILCDGMGTGKEAARLSGYAVRLLEKLLKIGLSPEAAMALLNGNMILRGSGTFSTVDLLRLDLYTGMGHIYKWGAAPSLWREGERVRKIGTPTLPPGVGIGGDELPEKFELPMAQGQLLVMISDGAYCVETEAIVGAYRASSPRDLAALLVGNMEADDDMTAIVVSLGVRPT